MLIEFLNPKCIESSAVSLQIDAVVTANTKKGKMLKVEVPNNTSLLPLKRVLDASFTSRYMYIPYKYVKCIK